MAQTTHSQLGSQRGAPRGNPVSRWFGDRKVNTKILAAVAILALVASAVGFVAIVRLASLDKAADQISGEGLGSIDAMDSVRLDIRQARIDLLNHALAEDAAGMAKLEDALKADDKAVADAIATYEKHPMGSAWQKLMDRVKADWAAYVSARDSIAIPASRANDSAAFLKVEAEVLIPTIADENAAMNKLSVLEHKDARHIAAVAHSTYTSARTIVLALLIGGLALGLGVALLIGRMIVGPLKKVSAALDAVADGDLTHRVDVDTKDELGDMARAVNTASESLAATVRSMSASAQTLAAASEQLSATSDQIAASAEQTSTQAGVVASAAEEVSSNVQTVAAGTEEMGASIREIAQNAADAARVAAQAVMVAASTNETVSALGVSSQEIGAVVKVITSIAEQTNLLALNATIEAARAGEAGKGFAVVANEVKDLAQETAKATEDIARRVEAIQADTGGAVTAIGEISEVIARINDYQTTIAAAVEEQTATTNEMARNVSDAATGASQIAENVVGVATAAETTTTGVGESQRAAADLARMSSELQQLVGNFRY
jgi:methyl-accepting chemotaxis protein